MNSGSWIGVAGIVIGIGVAFWQWYSAKKKGDQLVAFLHGLKGAKRDLPPAVVEQIDDMLARLNPPKERRFP